MRSTGQLLLLDFDRGRRGVSYNRPVSVHQDLWAETILYEHISKRERREEGSSHVMFRLRRGLTAIALRCLAGLLMSRHARVGCLQLEDPPIQHSLFNPCQLSARCVRGLTTYPAHRLEMPRQFAR